MITVKSVCTGEVIATIRYAGDYGGIIIGGVTRQDEETRRESESLASDIRRHCNVRSNDVSIQTRKVFFTSGREFDRLFDAIEYESQEDAGLGSWTFRFKQKRDSMHTRTSTEDLREVYEYAYQFPHDFECLTQLSGEQSAFLAACIQMGLADSK